MAVNRTSIEVAYAGRTARRLPQSFNAIRWLELSSAVVLHLLLVILTIHCQLAGSFAEMSPGIHTAKA